MPLTSCSLRDTKPEWIGPKKKQDWPAGLVDHFPDGLQHRARGAGALAQTFWLLGLAPKKNERRGPFRRLFRVSSVPRASQFGIPGF